MDMATYISAELLACLFTCKTGKELTPVAEHISFSLYFKCQLLEDSLTGNASVSKMTVWLIRVAFRTEWCHVSGRHSLCMFVTLC